MLVSGRSGVKGERGDGKIWGSVAGGGGTGGPFLAESFAVPAAHMLALNMLAHFVAVLAMLAWLPPTAAPLSSTG